MRIRTTERVMDEDGKAWEPGTLAESLPAQPVDPGMDFATATGEVLWLLMPSQYEVISAGEL